MGRKNKNILGGAASGAAAGASFGAPGALIGGALGGLFGSQEETEARQAPLAVPQDVVDRLYAESVGATPTAATLRNNAMYDKTLAQQIAAAAASRGTNAGLLQRNVARLAAEQSQANAQQAAAQAAEEKNAALGRYLQAKQLNAVVQNQNLNAEMAADERANRAFGSGLQGLAGAFGTLAQKKDAEKQMSDAVQKSATESNMVKEPMNVGNYSLSDNSVDKAKDLNMSYSLGADLSVPSYSDKKMKKNVVPMQMSDERQKELISDESLPANNNLQMQNQQASAQPMQAPEAQQAPAPQPAMATTVPQTPVAPPKPTFEITGEMLQKAKQSSKGGGNVSNIADVQGTLKRPDENISQERLDFYAQEASRQERRGGPSYRELLNRFIAEDYASKQAQNEAYDKEQANVASQNAIKNAERIARLSRFYTGLATPNANLVASQFQAPPAVAQGNLGVAESRIKPWWQLSDERKKMNEKSEDKQNGGNFNPKSFLDKLNAYSYEYKDEAKDMPGAGEGRRLGIMAQELEKAGPVGKSMVKQDESGNKVVDYGAGFGAILASQAHLNERLAQLEKMYGKKK